MRVILTARPRKNPFIPVEAETIVPARFLPPMEGMTVAVGNRTRPLTDIFEVAVEGNATDAAGVEVVLRGDNSRLKRIGEYMEAGKILVEGDIGMHCGNFMKGGEIEIRGNADGWLGREMRGGRILCHGSASHYCGSGYRGEKHGMRGGVLEVKGGSGDFTAEYLAGGEVIIHGDCGDMPGVEMKGGTLTIHGSCTRPCGNMTGGTCTVLGKVTGMLPTFLRAGTVTWEPGGVILTRFEGDVANRGKGTLLAREWQYTP
ncbi:MAG: formylmethanofuran dehydrogenase subunit C [Methanomicrobiales archaeon]|nr:formylmethanofuran dehydrogenase subunit C [Methanomicrobiales archaeon]